jgi:VWFA-related protein
MISYRGIGLFLLVSVVCVAPLCGHQTSGAPVNPKVNVPPNTQNSAGNDRVVLDVVVTPKSGPPVADLQQQDFTVLDNKNARPIDSFQAFSADQTPINTFLVVDDVNTGFQNVAYERSEMEKFLHDNGGHLALPTALAFLTDKGLEIQDEFSRDGNALASTLDKYEVGLHSVLRSSGIYGAVERFQISLNALMDLANRQAAQPGRKIILWVSPGWPLLSGPGVEIQMDDKQRQQIYSDVIRLSTLLRLGHITIYSIDPLGSSDFSGRAFYWESFQKGPSKASQADWGDIALQVLAVQSGGLAITVTNDITASLQRCVMDTQHYYELSFAPSLEGKPGEFHQIQVHVDKPGLTARTRTGYYPRP